MTTNSEDIAAQFFAAIEAADMGQIAELYADDVEVWHSNGKPPQSKEENIAVLRQMTTYSAPRYEIIHRS